MQTRTTVVASVVFCALFVFIWSFPGRAASREAREPAKPQIEKTLSTSRVDWQPAGDAESVVLTVAGPGDLFLREEFPAGKTPFLSLLKRDGSPLPDGSYTYELRTGRPSARPILDSGYLAIRDGRFAVLPTPSDSDLESSIEKQTINDDLTVTGRLVVEEGACIGASCTLSDALVGLRLKDTALRIYFDDVPDQLTNHHDWLIKVNDSIAGPGEYFSISDVEAGTTPFSIEGYAPHSALYVRSNGNLGLGTVTPAQDIHAISGNTPTIRLEQDGSASLSTRTWDLGASHSSFFVKDVTNSSAVPFRIAAGAPASSLEISSSGAVGVGTSSPASRFHFFENADANTILTVETPNTGLSAAGVLRAKSDTAIVNVGAHGSGRTLSRFGQTLASWAEIMQLDGNGLIIGTLGSKPLILGTSSTNRVHITAAGSVGIGTTSPTSLLHVSGGDIRVQSGSFIDDGVTLNAPDYVFEPDYRLMPIEDLKEFVARERHLPNVPSAAEIKEKGLNLSQFQMRLLEKIEELALYTVTQHEQIKSQKARIDELQGVNAKLDARLEALEREAEKP
ncbi:MAG TPA: hypothetical protein VLT87_01380 [Thermoanaerobaculia bacterium]|nr:hypothetical protein [Thermoanaerobaculia bacterium]